jgi:hypothetical protein
MKNKFLKFYTTKMVSILLMRCNHSDSNKSDEVKSNNIVSILLMRCNHSDGMCLKPLALLRFSTVFRAPSFFKEHLSYFLCIKSKRRWLFPLFHAGFSFCEQPRGFLRYQGARKITSVTSLNIRNINYFQFSKKIKRL